MESYFKITCFIAATIIAIVSIGLLTLLKKPYKLKLGAFTLAGLASIYWLENLNFWITILGATLLLAVFIVLIHYLFIGMGRMLRELTTYLN